MWELVDVGYVDPLDPREDYPTQESEDYEAERWEQQDRRRRPPERA